MAEGSSGAGSKVPMVATGRESWIALGALILFAACLPEFLTGSTFVQVALLHPLGFAQLVGLYGGGALVIREVTVRWNKRWASVLLLGGVYAIVEEGYGTRNMMDPTGSNVGTYDLFSHWLGINWIPFVPVTLFHAVFSIAFMILLVELLFPATRGKRLVGNAGLAGAFVALGLASTTMAIAEPYIPSWPVIAFFAALSLTYVVVAYLVPRDLLSSKSLRPDCPEWMFFVVGASFVAEVFLLIIGPHSLPAAVLVGFFCASALLFLYLLVRYTGRDHNEVRKIDFCLGMVGFMVPIDIIATLTGDLGVLVVTALALALLLYLRKMWTASSTWWQAHSPRAGL
jgi:hypothetical protein